MLVVFLQGKHKSGFMRCNLPQVPTQVKGKSAFEASAGVPDG